MYETNFHDQFPTVAKLLVNNINYDITNITLCLDEILNIIYKQF